MPALDAPSPMLNTVRLAASAACFAIACAPIAAHAIYKCAGPGTAPVYQDEPCAAGKELRNFDADPPNLSIVPGRPNAAAIRETSPARAPREPKPKADKRAKARGDPAERKHVRVGMSDGELIARLGAPDVTAGGRKGTRWTWLPVDGDPDTITTVTLANGTVVDVDRKVVKK
jgi:hypothetical protein